MEQNLLVLLVRRKNFRNSLNFRKDKESSHNFAILKEYPGYSRLNVLQTLVGYGNRQ